MCKAGLMRCLWGGWVWFSRPLPLAKFTVLEFLSFFHSINFWCCCTEIFTDTDRTGLWRNSNVQKTRPEDYIAYLLHIQKSIDTQLFASPFFKESVWFVLSETEITMTSSLAIFLLIIINKYFDYNEHLYKLSNFHINSYLTTLYAGGFVWILQIFHLTSRLLKKVRMSWKTAYFKAKGSKLLR